MFIELAPMLANGNTVALTISSLETQPVDDPRLCVTLTPIPANPVKGKKGEEDEENELAEKLQALNQPISIHGLASELDRDLPGVLKEFVQQRNEGLTKLTSLENEITAAEEEAKKRLDEAKKKLAPRVTGKADDPTAIADAPGKHAKPAVL